jgi:hypothetical protein
MTSVFVVILVEDVTFNYGGVCGVFSTNEKAITYCQKEFEQLELVTGGYYTTENLSFDSFFTIVEFDLDS